MAVVTEPGWLTVVEAARSLGVSRDIVRRRLQRGELAGRRVPTRYGLGWEVNLDIAPTAVPVSATTVAPASTVVPTTVTTAVATAVPASESSDQPMLALIRLVESQQQTIRELSCRVGSLEAQLEAARPWWARCWELVAP